ncbi:MAG: ATP-binding cassette domain-containing protein [Gammaproteobacteria bacterium]|nr:ATP-binding cassette domain-containing protein [Gammaproteobacteria bacterium]
MNVLGLEKISLAYGHLPLLDHVDLQIESGERVCLIGRNGAGKSTLLKVIAGRQHADDGAIRLQSGMRVAYLEQDVPLNNDLTVFEFVAKGLGDLGEVIKEYHELTNQVAISHDDSLMNRMAELQHRLDAEDGWALTQKVESVITRLQLDADKKISELSGGMRRRVTLGKTLVNDPDLLLLDEPTNHLDITSIIWLEEFLQNYSGAIIFITHDRSFLGNLATRIIEIDRGILRSYPGSYVEYQKRKEQELASEDIANKHFDKKLAEEEKWIRKGIKARRTRNEGRVRALQSMRKERQQRRDKQKQVNIELVSSENAGKIVADLSHVSFSYEDKDIVNDLSTRIVRGDRIGILGPNGTGKSTLLKLILGDLIPDSGDVVLGTKLKLAYYDQHRDQLDLEKTVKDNVNDGQDYINIKGHSRHVISYLKDFLFPVEKINTPVKALSGGERNRLLLAKIFTKPANLLVMDEPTNDLDVDTLELLEELLMEFDGTLLLVSHDRRFLDNVVTSTLVFEGEGRVQEYVGGYEDWLRQRDVISAKNSKRGQEKTPVKEPRTKTKVKLSYKDQRELDALPKKIESLENEQALLQSDIGGPEFYQQDGQLVKDKLERVTVVEKELNEAYSRWEMLE